MYPEAASLPKTPTFASISGYLRFSRERSTIISVKSIVIFLCSLPLALSASYTVKDGNFVPSEYVTMESVQDHYSALLDAYQKEEWKTVVRQGLVITKNFPDSFFADEALFYLGMSYFHIEEYDLANTMLTRYLKAQSMPKFFEQAMMTKFVMAKKFHEGARTPLFGVKGFPKWVSAKDMAFELYEEVIAALPQLDLCAEALYGKGKWLLESEKYQESLETFSSLIQRFPKHPLAVDAYLGIADVFLTQCQKEYPDQDFLDLAEINVRRFSQDFPLEEKVVLAQAKFEEMKEIYAKKLYEIAQFYQRTKRYPAAAIYYQRLIHLYPQTHSAKSAKEMLAMKHFSEL